VGDNPDSVYKNRQRLAEDAELVNEPVWLNQIHSNRVVEAFELNQEADASYTSRVGQVCAVMTADCLPVLFCNERGTKVAAAHAGWRGLLDGVLENVVNEIRDNDERIYAWMGPAIGPSAFEVGEDVISAFVDYDLEAEAAFHTLEAKGKWLANIYLLAKQRLVQIGVKDVFGGNYCTYLDEKRFFSYRRDKVCGRMASLIWLDN